VRGSFAVLILLAAVGPVVAVDLHEAGRTYYVRYCAACHGVEGRGDGPVTPALGERPTDLTQLANEHGDDYPFWAIVEAIDGRRTIRAHGVSEMPVWGTVLSPQASWSPREHAEARGTVILVTEYLRTLQRSGKRISSR
jgi:mono/diheme cytochrome c family protein